MVGSNPASWADRCSTSTTGEGADGQGPALEAGDLAQVGLGCLHLPYDLAGMAGQHLAGFGGYDPAGASVEQRLPDLLFELAQLMGNGGGRVHHEFGRCRD